ncbi:MAG: hypothetical protein EXR71_17095 [Myxococcales bacterium]|nr:hypothetical protein [Myxococcales bacterium]
MVRDARHRVHVARQQGVARLWSLETDVLTRATQWLGKAHEGPALVARAADVAEQFVSRQLERAVAVPLAGYDELNVKQVQAAVQTLSYVDLLRVRRYEEANKGRKLVLAAIEKQCAGRVAPPVEIAAEA